MVLSDEERQRIYDEEYTRELERMAPEIHSKMKRKVECENIGWGIKIDGLDIYKALRKVLINIKTILIGG